MKWLFGLSLLLSYTTALAGQCDQDNVKSVERPIVAGGLSKFSYKYAIRKGSDLDKPTVLFLPGGPGLPSIGSSNPRVPKEFSAIQTDPRGVGCNSPEGANTYPDDFYKTENLAADVVAIVKAEQLSNYIIYGESYGTQLATVVSAQLQSSGLPLPKAVVLEGVLGRAFRAQEAAQGYIDLWDKIKSLLSPGAVSALSQPETLGYNSSVWGSFFETYSLLGTMPAGFVVKNLLSLTDPVFSQEQRQPLIANLEQKKGGALLDANSSRLYKQIACNEIVDDYGPENNFQLTEGRLVPVSQSYCGELKLSRPFDSAKYQIQVPIYYFEGTFDPATPMTQARYHFDHQTSAPKVFVTVDEGGHGALSFSASLCSSNIWKLIGEGQLDLSASLQSCGLKLNQEIRINNSVF